MSEGLQGFREQIDFIDAQLISLLGARFAITRQVGQFKLEQDLPPRDPEREAAQLDRARELSEAVGLNPAFATAFQQLILTQVVADHTALRQPQG